MAHNDERAADNQDHLRAAAAAWANEGAQNVPPAERLQRIRQSPAAEALVFDSPRISRWPLLALAACVLLMVGVATFSMFSRPASVPPETGVTKEGGAAEFVVAAQVLGSPSGLFHASATGPRNWLPLKRDDRCAAGELIQAAFWNGSGELRLAGGPRVELRSGTLVRLGNDPKRPQLHLWRGAVKLHVESLPLELYTLGEHGVAKAVKALPVATQVVYRATAQQQNTFQQAGSTLISDDGLSATDCAEVAELAAPEVKNPVQIDDGTARLLNVIKCQYREKPLSEIVESLRDALGIRLTLSASAQEKFGNKLFSLELGDVTGAEALARLAELVGLQLTVRDGEVVLELPTAKQAAAPAPVEDTF